MKRIIKRITQVLVALVLLLIVAIVGVLIYIDSIAKLAVERGGSAALGVSTTVESVNLSLLKGECGINSLTIANPSGYDSAHFMTLKTGKLDVAPATLLQDKIIVPDLELNGVDLSLEEKDGKANYEVIMDNLHSLQGSSQAQSQAPVSAGGAGSKKYIINKVVIKNVTVHADLLPLGGGITRTTINIPEIDLPNGVGSDTSNGVLLSQVSGTITQALLKAVSDKIGSALPGDMGKTLSTGLQGFGNIASTGAKVVGDLGNQAKQIGKGLGDQFKDVGKGLKGIFGGDQDKQKDQSSGD